MVRISTLVFFDIETTGLPHKEQNRTKITELCLIAISRHDLRSIKANPHSIRLISKLTFMLNPGRKIQPAASAITGLTNDMLKYAPTFEKKFNTMKAFLEGLKEPVCLVAHNGNAFDYKILLAECDDANVKLMEGLLCVDSLVGFKELLMNKSNFNISKSFEDSDESLLTDDSDEELFRSVDDVSYEKTPVPKQHVATRAKTVKTNTKTLEEKTKRESYKLIDIYKRLFKVEPENAHRAEDDCLMLLQCVVACQNAINLGEDFLHWADENCKRLDMIIPLKRK